jgi:hypothetical protein
MIGGPAQALDWFSWKQRSIAPSVVFHSFKALCITQLSTSLFVPTIAFPISLCMLNFYSPLSVLRCPSARVFLVVCS